MSKTLDVYFSFSSPFVYLAQTQLPALVDRYQCQINYHFIDLRKLMQLTGNPGPAQVASKLNYLIKDVKDWKNYYNIPLNIPSRFPIDNRPPIAAALVAKKAGKLTEFMDAVFQAYYVDGRNIDYPEVLKELAVELGLDSETIISAINDPEIQQEIDAETKAAAEKGVFGIPTFFVGDDMYWGNDRLIFVEAALKR